jgi:hypothetical protein
MSLQETPKSNARKADIDEVVLFHFVSISIFEAI